MGTEAIILLSATIIKTVWAFVDQVAKSRGMPPEDLRKQVLKIANEHDKTAEQILGIIDAEMKK